jgi:hypothetical protein
MVPETIAGPGWKSLMQRGLVTRDPEGSGYLTTTEAGELLAEQVESGDYHQLDD